MQDITGLPLHPKHRYDLKEWKALRHSGALGLTAAVLGSAEFDVVIMPLADAVDALLGSAGITAAVVCGGSGIQAIELTTGRVIRSLRGRPYGEPYKKDDFDQEEVYENDDGEQQEGGEEGATEVNRHIYGHVPELAVFDCNGRSTMALLDCSKEVSLLPVSNWKAKPIKIPIPATVPCSFKSSSQQKCTCYLISVSTMPDRKGVIVGSRKGWSRVRPNQRPEEGEEEEAIVTTVEKDFHFLCPLPANRMLHANNRRNAPIMVSDANSGHQVADWGPLKFKTDPQEKAASLRSPRGQPAYLPSLGLIACPASEAVIALIEPDSGTLVATIQGPYPDTKFVCQLEDVSHLNFQVPCRSCVTKADNSLIGCASCRGPGCQSLCWLGICFSSGPLCFLAFEVSETLRRRIIVARNLPLNEAMGEDQLFINPLRVLHLPTGVTDPTGLRLAVLRADD